MKIHVFKTHCKDCREEVEERVKASIVDFIVIIQLKCQKCGCVTCIELDK